MKNPNADGPPELWLLCSPGDPDAKELSFDQLDCDDLCEPPVIMVRIIQSEMMEKKSDPYYYFSLTC